MRASLGFPLPIGVLLLCALTVRLVEAQNDSAPTAPATGFSATGEGVREVEPNIIYRVIDKDGKLQPVVNVSIDDFERWVQMDQARTQGQQPPKYRFAKIAADGKVSGGRAELAVEYTVFVDDWNWVRVPLRLAGAVVRGAVRYDGPGEMFLQYDEAADEYVAWIRDRTRHPDAAGADTAAPRPHRLTLDALASVEQVSGRYRLRLSTPRVWDSELNLRVPQEQALAEASGGAQIDSRQFATGATTFKILGLNGDLTVTWWTQPQETADAPAVLEATGFVLERIDGRSVRSEAELAISSFSGPFQSFRVRLPAGSTLLPVESVDYTVTPVLEKQNGSESATLVEVALPAPTVGPSRVRLVTERAHNAVDPREPLDLAGFEVLGAVRQSGFVAVEVRDDWQVLWGTRQQVRQVELRQAEALPEDLWVDDVTATFEYFGQPYSLQARIVPRETRIAVEPEYVVQVEAERARLDARFKYRVGGAKVFDLEIDLPGWEIEDVGSINPPNLVRVDDILPGETTPLVLPLVHALTGEFEILVRARRPLPPGANTFDFVVPRPKANVVGAARLVIQPDDNIELAPREGEVSGLVRQRTRPDVGLPARQQPPWVYRSEADEARFAANFRVHARTISVDVDSTVRLTADGAAVQQQLSYHVAREPLDSVNLDVPLRLAESGQLLVTMAGRTLTWGRVGAEPNDPARVRVTLPTPRIGDFRLETEFTLSDDKPSPGASVSLRVPLVMPGDGELARNQLSVTTDEGIKARPLGGLWNRDEDATPARQSNTFRLSASVPRNELQLGVQLDEDRPAGEIVIERAWVQSWFTAQTRQDRVVYRFSTREPLVRLELPKGILGRAARALIDGRPIEPSLDVAAPNELVIPLDQTAKRPRSYLLEVDYEQPRDTRQLAVDMDLPRLGLTPRMRRLYWQLILPADEHLIDVPAGMLPEYRWAWNGLFWARRPQLDQSQLEAWTGALHLAEIPAGTNQYLFGSQQWPGPIQLRVASRSLLVVVSSGVALVIGLALIYLSVARHPIVLLAGSLALLSLGAIYPDTALVVAQAAGAGVVLALVAGLLERTMARRHSRSVLMRNPASVLSDRGSTQTHRRPVAVGASSVTTVGAPFPSAESSS